MDLSQLSLFKMMSQRMSWLNERQEVLAQNIANANTPGYRGRDLQPLDFRQTLGSTGKLAAARTDAAHIEVSSGPAKAFQARVQGKPYETAPDGNAVEMEEQMVKMAQTQVDYQMITNLYRKHVSMIKTAIGRNG